MGSPMHYPRETYDEARRRVADGGRYLSEGGRALMDRVPDYALPERWRPRDNRETALTVLGVGAAALVFAGAWYLVSTEPRRRRLKRSARRAYRTLAG